jgi:hypothetical protein
MTLSKITEKALLAVYGELPSLPIPRADVSQVKCAVASAVFETQFTTRSALEAFIEGQENYEKSNRINRYLIEATGLGPTLFTVTSLSHPDLEISGSTTLLAFDEAHFAELESSHARSSRREKNPYRENLYFLWTQSKIDGELVYEFLSAAGQYLWHVLEDVLFGWMNENFPLKVLEPRTMEEVARDIHRQMSATRPEEAVRFETYSSGSRLIRTMLIDEGRGSMFDNDPPWVYLRKTGDEHENRREIIFSNRVAMGKVSFGSFHADVAKLTDGSADFEARTAALVDEFKARLEKISVSQEQIAKE